MLQPRLLTRLVIGLSGAAVTAGVLAAGASASTVTVRTGSDGPEAYYVAAPGEVNDVFVFAISDTRIRITDPGAVIHAVGRCRSIDAHTAVCRGDLLTAQVELGDLNDHVATSMEIESDAEMVVDGGPGDDVLNGGNNDAVVLDGGDGDDRLYGSGDAFDKLHGSEGDDQLYGGDGGSELDGGGGTDKLHGGAAGDILADGDREDGGPAAAPGPDALDGGGGQNTLSYEERTRPVMGRAGTSTDAGEAGEGDSAIGITNIVGGAGNDHLIGNARVNELDGGGGNNVLEGRGNADTLDGGRGDDQLGGGTGGDFLFGGPGSDTLSCGRGADVVEEPQSREILPRSCEEAVFSWDGGRRLFVRPHPTAGRMRPPRFRLICPKINEDANISCRGSIRVRETGGRHRLFGRTRFRHDHPGPADTFTAPLALTPLGRRWWARRLGNVSATVTLRVVAKETPRRPFKWRISRA